MSKSTIFIIVIVILIIIGVVFFVGFKPSQIFTEPSQIFTKPDVLTEPDAIAPVVVGGDKSGPQLRVFNIIVNRDGFDPDEIIVNHQDRIQFNLTALDGTYDLFMDVFKLYITIPQGEKRTVSFEAARKGPWKFVCRDYCPEGKTIEGEIMVLEK